MDQEEFQRYLEDRYEDQCQWYSGKASINKSRYYIFQTSLIVFSGLATLTVALGISFPDTNWIRLLAISLTASVTVLASLQKVFRFQENWIEYRNTAESLKKERYLHLARLEEYAKTDSPDKLFVARVESLISRQNTAWSTRTHGDSDNDSTS